MNTTRKIASEEISFLREMLYESLFVPEGAEPFDKSILEQPQIARYIQGWGNSPNDVACVAVSAEGNLIGAIWGRTFTKEAPGYGFVDEQTPEIGMAVKEGYRSQGIGTQLISEITQVYQDMGVEALSLSVNKQNKAKYLYEILGFETVRENGDTLVMKKELI
ncbi:hypothetical protein BKI52_29230 [marine bacterium AO1-C]|nr:hypothetical protein BKI52_29230 [marine bacterium AO1-C]